VPLPEMKGSMVKCMLVVALIGAAESPEFFGTIKTSPPTLPSFS
jgi:hypothetical protein